MHADVSRLTYYAVHVCHICVHHHGIVQALVQHAGWLDAAARVATMARGLPLGYDHVCVCVCCEHV